MKFLLVKFPQTFDFAITVVPRPCIAKFPPILIPNSRFEGFQHNCVDIVYHCRIFNVKSIPIIEIRFELLHTKNAWKSKQNQ